MKQLGELCEDGSVKIRKLALLTQLAVFLDVIPGYRIRMLSEKEAKSTVSKEVRSIRAYEQGVLSNYQAFLKSLETIISQGIPFSHLSH